jgi:hypothetical protein
MCFYIQYVKEWIALHPKGAATSSYLIYSKKTKGILGEDSLRGIYERHPGNSGYRLAFISSS